MSESLYRFIPGPGITSVRTDWTKAAAHLLFVAGIVTESHQDRAAGSFLLYQDDWLCGQAKAFSHSGLSQDAISHNCLTVDGARQVLTHDGCRYLAQEDTPSYCYLAADLTAAYQGQFAAYHREIFFLKPNLLVIRDVFTPVNAAAVITHNLNVLTQPVADLTGGFTVVSDSGARLFGVAADWHFAASLVPLEPEQTRPTYRLQLTGAGALRYCVGLEIATPTQAQRTVTPYASTALQGMVCGNSLVAAVTLPVPLTYTSPTSGDHWFYGLKPNTTYTVNGAQWIATSAGVLHFPGAPLGMVVTITEGVPIPPPVKGRTFNLFIPGDGSAPVFSEVPPAAREEG